jgi:hypothetical protein
MDFQTSDRHNCSSDVCELRKPIMAQHFSETEWQRIESHLDSDPAFYGLPTRRDGSIILMSWNIRKFGSLAEGGELKKSAGATRMIERVAATADLLAIQEQQDNTEALYHLQERLNANGGDFGVVISDITGEAPGRRGMAERMAWLYNRTRVKRGDLASDLTFDRSAVTQNINIALKASLATSVPGEDDPSYLDKIKAWVEDSTRLVASKFKAFVQFIRSPHLVEFIVDGPDGRYEFYAVNAHLVSGNSKTEREQEFFALLEWLLLSSEKAVTRDGKIYLLMADLNLDFGSSLDRRRQGIENYITRINTTRNLQAKVNFPFLDGGIRTNARGTETFDHIAWLADDTRLPRGRHNSLAGTLGPDQYDYGMFNFTKLFVEAGPGALPAAEPDFDRFSHDFTDHMPIWVRLPLPSSAQHDFSVNE